MNKNRISDRFNGDESIRLRSRAKRYCKATGNSDNALDMSIIFDEFKNDDTLLVSINNTGAKTHRVALFAGALTTPDQIKKVAGVDVDCVAKEGLQVEETSGDGGKVSITCDNLDYIQDYIRHNPTRVNAMQLSASDASQLYRPVTITKFNIFGSQGSKGIKPNAYLKPSNNNDKMCIIDDIKHLQLDGNTIMDFEVLAGKRLDIAFQFGASFDSANILKDAAHVVLG